MRTLFLLMAGCGRLGFGSTEPPDAARDASVDAAPDLCDPVPSEETVALYAFDGSLTADAQMQHDAVNLGVVASADARCGTGAARFAGTGYLRVADAPAFDLPEGSIDLFVRTRTPASGTLQGIVSRDANGTALDGHFVIGLAAGGELFVRLQHTPNTHRFRCTAAPVAADTWLHVAVSFGAPGLRMWLDGVEVTGTTFVYDGGVVGCEEPHAFGIDGNDNALVIGGLNHLAAEGAPEPTVQALLTGEVDHVRVRSTWRDYSRSR